MFYSWDITIPANTAKADPKTKRLKLSKGVVTGIFIKFPAGCSGMVGVRIYRGESQLVPLNRDGRVTGDDEIVPTEQYYELLRRPYYLKFAGHSEGTIYNHTVTVRVQVLPKEVATFMPLIQLLTKFFKRIGLI